MMIRVVTTPDPPAPLQIFFVVNVQIKGWVDGCTKIRTLFRFVNPYELLDDP